MKQVAPITARVVPKGKPDDYSDDLTLDVYDQEGNRLFAVGYQAIHVPANLNVQKAIVRLLEYGLRVANACNGIFVLEETKTD